MFPHTVTLYNVVHETDLETARDVRTSYVTLLRGVLLDEAGRVEVSREGREDQGAVSLYIPLDVEAADGVSGAVKAYAPPKEFFRAEDRSGLWTLSSGEGETFFIPGETVEPELSFEELAEKYDGVCAVTRVDEKNFGGLKHWEVGRGSRWRI